MMRKSVGFVRDSSLSSRELEVLRMISLEYTTKEIARQLNISPHTVITHRRNMMIKLEARNSAGLVRRGFEWGVLHC